MTMLDRSQGDDATASASYLELAARVATQAGAHFGITKRSLVGSAWK
jgi:hypothetical protein